MDPLRILLFAVAIPAATTLLALLPTRRFGPGLALACGMIAGYLGLEGVPKGWPAESWQWLLPGALAAGALSFLPWRPRWGREDALPVLLSLTVVSTASALCLGLSGTVRIAQLCGALAASSGACALLGRRTEPILPPAVLLLPGFWWIGWRYAELPIPSALLLAAALFAGLAPWKGWALRIAAPAVPASVAVWIAFSRSPALDY